MDPWNVCMYIKIANKSKKCEVKIPWNKANKSKLHISRNYKHSKCGE
jgi:hypothetical protein